MALSSSSSNGMITLTHPKGPSLHVLLYGATIISWDQHLFVSSKAALDGSKAVRGGIPVIFPCFGAPQHSDHLNLPQHGFARTTNWSWDGTTTNDESSLTITLTLDPTDAIRQVYTRDFSLAYTITLFQHALTTQLTVKNTAVSDNLDFQALFHNYFRAPSQHVLVSPLNDLHYFDKTTSENRIESRAAVDVKQTTDSVYQDAPQDYQVTWPAGGVAIKTTNLKDVVVWNPQETGSKIADMEEGGWERYVCVEPGHVHGFLSLSPGSSWSGKQTISLIHQEKKANVL